MRSLLRMEGPGRSACRLPDNSDGAARGIGMMLVLGLAVAPILAGMSAIAAPADASPAAARYIVRMMPGASPKLSVEATIPIDGSTVEMDSTRPAVIDELGSPGWPVLISDLEARDEAGQPVELNRSGEAGWALAKPHSGRLTLTYQVDYSPLAGRSWPAPREAAYADADYFSTVARALFITTPRVKESLVRFEPAPGWRPVTPWRPSGSSGREFAVRSRPELVENFVVFSRVELETMSASGFRLLVTPMGDWRPMGPEVRQAIGSAVRQFVRIMQFKGEEGYLVVLLPIREGGGESFRNSFAGSAEETPSRETLPRWANTIAHEIFHYWNGWRLHGADYPATQWFHEGFTEYAANVALVASGVIDEAEFRKKLAAHVGNYRKLQQPLAASVTHKGPPLYSGGALVAFCWDVRIRKATDGKKGLGDFLRALWSRTEGGERPYAWSDLRASLERTAPGDWETFYREHVEGSAPLPLSEAFASVGLRLVPTADGGERVEADPAAPAAARARWQSLVAGR